MTETLKISRLSLRRVCENTLTDFVLRSTDVTAQPVAEGEDAVNAHSGHPHIELEDTGQVLPTPD